MLIGENKETTIIDGRGNKVIQTIYSGECNISNFTIINGTYGLYIKSHYTNIFDNIIVNNTYGISIVDYNRIKIFNNYITGEKWGIVVSSFTVSIYHNNFNNCGIKIHGVGHKIYENQIKDAETAIVLDECKNTKITRNNIINENENLVKFKNFNKYFANNWNHNYWSDWKYPFPPYIITPPRIIEGTVILWDPLSNVPRKEKEWINFDWFPARKPFDLHL